MKIQKKIKPEKKTQKNKRFSKRDKTDQIIRIGELEELMSQYGDDVDP